MSRDRSGWRTLLVLLLVTTAACGTPQDGTPQVRGSAAPPSTSELSRDAVCERFFTDIADVGTTELSQTNGRVTSPPQAVQHLEGLETLRQFGRWARDAQDPAQADLAVRIEVQAEQVGDRLSPEDSDRRAQRVTEDLYRATAELYYDCQRELYQSLLRTGGVPMTGACAEPGAPTLDGPNVMVYGSSGRLIDATCELVQGTRQGDGCAYSNTAESAPGETGARGSEEVAYDPDTCRALFEHGRVKPDR